MLLEEPYTPKRLQEADQRRRVDVAVRPPVGRRPLTSRLIHLPLPDSFWESIHISYCAAIVVRIRVSAQGVAGSNRCPYFITSDQSGVAGGSKGRTYRYRGYRLPLETIEAAPLWVANSLYLSTY